MLQNNPTIWETNPKLRALLLILIGLFLFSGIGLAVFSFAQNQYRQKIYAETQAGLPKHEATQATITPQTNQVKDFAITDSQTAGWKTYINTKYNFAFDYPSDFQLNQDPVYQLPDGKGNSFDVLTIGLNKGGDLRLTINMNRPGAGCGETAVAAEKNILEAGNIKITKNTYERQDANSSCFEYSGFGKGFYILAFVPKGDSVNEKIFDGVVKSFKFIDSSATSTWKTYKNDQYGFEFKYPLNWVAYDCGEKDTVFINPGNFPCGTDGWADMSLAMDSGNMVPKIIKDIINLNSQATQFETVFASNPATTVSYYIPTPKNGDYGGMPYPTGHIQNILFFRNDVTYHFNIINEHETDPNFQATENSIINSFKFTK